MPALLETTFVKPVIVYRGMTSPALKDSITQDGRTVDMTGASVSFYLRPLVSRVPVINGAAGLPLAPADQNGNNVEYQWVSGDVASEGQYMAWWRFTPSGGVAAETPEFPLYVTDHGPGDGVRTGAIADGAGDYLPTTYAALRDSDDFGDRRIQHKATLIQVKIMGAAVDPDVESQSYSLALLDYFSKRLALELIQPGIDYWSRQQRTSTTQGPTEIVSYPDIIGSLERLADRLRSELADDWRELALLVPNLTQRRVEALPISSLDDATRPWLAKPVTKNPYLTLPLDAGAWFYDELIYFPTFA